MDQAVETSTKLVSDKYKGEDGRRRELANAIREDTRRLFGQIECGLTVEFRANAVKDEKPENQKALEDINQFGTVLKFPEIAKESTLLGSGEVLEGEITTTTHTKRTPTEKKTSASKKESQKVPKEAEVKM